MPAAGITEALILAKNAAEGIKYQPGWILATTATVKIFIDIFIGIWAFILGLHLDQPHQPDLNRQGEGASEILAALPEVHHRVSRHHGDRRLPRARGTGGDRRQGAGRHRRGNTFRVLFFILTFFSIGVLSNFRQLWQEGIGKLAAVYVISLFGFVIWVGLLISWLFFNGLHPPLAS